jgi:beta-1,4-N-acetylglucosaminyltransferase
LPKPVHSPERRDLRTDSTPLDLLLVCSAGGHVLELMSLRRAWSPFSRAWVTLEGNDTRSLLHGERVFFAHGPTERNVLNLLRNLVLAWRVVGELRPAAVVSTGAALAVPFAWVGRLRGSRVVYVESLARIDAPSLTGRLVTPVADRIYVQWPQLVGALRGARFVGNIFVDA